MTSQSNTQERDLSILSDTEALRKLRDPQTPSGGDRRENKRKPT